MEGGISEGVDPSFVRNCISAASTDDTFCIHCSLKGGSRGRDTGGTPEGGVCVGIRLRSNSTRYYGLYIQRFIIGNYVITITAIDPGGASFLGYRRI